jgi:hypothetical protein
MSEREFWIAVRQALLMLVDAVERKLQMSPTTSEIRQWHKHGK